MLIATPASVMTNALQRFDRASAKLVDSVSTGGEDAPEAIAETIEAKTQFKTGAAMVRMGDEMMRTLLDILAKDR